jgi:hypothetical protein
MWQDVVFAIGSLIFAMALVPSIRSTDKPALGTSLPTTLILYVFSMTYFSLELYYAAIVTLGTATLWAILAVQKWEMQT